MNLLLCNTFLIPEYIFWCLKEWLIVTSMHCALCTVGTITYHVMGLSGRSRGNLDLRFRCPLGTALIHTGFIRCAQQVCIFLGLKNSKMWDRGCSCLISCQLCFYSVCRKRKTTWVLTQTLIGIRCWLFFPSVLVAYLSCGSIYS